MYLLIKLTSAFINALPISVVLFLGKFVGLLFYYCDRKKRFIAYRNLKMVFPSYNSKLLSSILRGSFISFGLGLAESLIIPKIINKGLVDASELERVEGIDIFVTIHSGCWELYNAAFAKKSNFAILAQKQKNVAFDRFWDEQRRSNKIEICYSLKELIAFIKKGYWMGMVVDHGAEDNALLVEFFGKLVPTPQGAVYLAKKFNRKIYPAFGYREEDGRHTVKVANPIDCQGRSAQEVLREINAVCENFLRMHPQNYMWWYKRFKRKRTLQVVILSDAKAGHLNQSCAVANFLDDFGYVIQKEIIEVKVKSKAKRLLLELCAFFSWRMFPGHPLCLQFLLESSVHRRLCNTFADIVISTGSALAPLNVIFSNSLGAKSIVVLKPNLPLNKFNLAFIPEHDRVLADNVACIKGALNLAYDSQDYATQLSRCFSLSPERKISLFVGGPLEDDKAFAENLKVFIRRLKSFSIKTGYGLLVTTSRRTSGYVEDYIEKEFKEFKNTEVLIVANKYNYPFIVGGFLAASEVVFVTSDSISMISESLSMKKTTVAVELEDIFNTHHINFFYTVEEVLNILKPPYIIQALKTPAYSLSDYNAKVIRNALKKLL